jgi:hypothetical protein
MVGQMLYDHATTLSAAAIGNRSRRMMNVRKILDTTFIFPSIVWRIMPIEGGAANIQ